MTLTGFSGKKKKKNQIIGSHSIPKISKALEKMKKFYSIVNSFHITGMLCFVETFCHSAARD